LQTELATTFENNLYFLSATVIFKVPSRQQKDLTVTSFSNNRIQIIYRKPGSCTRKGE
jgi:hypothetical protein